MTAAVTNARRSAAVAVLRSAAVTVLICSLGAASSLVPAQATVSPPTPDVTIAPKDGPPSPEFPMRQDAACATGGVLPNSDLRQMPPPAASLRLDQAHKFSTGADVTVAVIGTGVAVQPRLPRVLPGGDYISHGDGLSDCDGLGTIVAGLIGGAPSEADGFIGVAPDAKILAIRQTSQAFKLESDGLDPNDPNNTRTAIDLRSLSRAIVHAADSGARVINISSPVCTEASHPGDQKLLAAALEYAVDSKDVLVVAAAGDVGQGRGSGGLSAKCENNPKVNGGVSKDPRNWSGVKVVSSPSWFDDLVLSVGFALADGTPVEGSMTGPWVDVGAPGYGIVSLGPSGDALINGMQGRDLPLVPIVGSAFAAAFVSGTAALIRSKFPQLSAREVNDRIVATAHPPAGGEPENSVGYGMVDPLAALTYDVTNGGVGVGRGGTDTLSVPVSAPPPDTRPNTAAVFVVGLILVVVAVVWLTTLLENIGNRRRT